MIPFKRIFFIPLFILFVFTYLVGLAQSQVKPRVMKAQRKYDIIVNQNNDTLTFNRALRSLQANPQRLNDRNIFSDMVSGYLGLGTSTLMTASQNLLSVGIGYIREAARDKRPDWQKAVIGENRFVKKLPMVTEVLNFYGSPSTSGALDPKDMQFNGFGCRQYITLIDEEGNPFEEEVFYFSCSIRHDDYGLARMLNHSKFEVVVDELRFNPYLSNLPNDTLSMNADTKHSFSFETRKDLEFKVKAKLFSSWINEAIQVHNDVPLGEFTIVAKIDSLDLDKKDNVFRYSRYNPEDKNKKIMVSGDAFLVPRSYIGSTDMKDNIPSWGTGQYRVEMEIQESCNINEEHYMTEDRKKWRKDRWLPEWKKMNKRPKKSPSQNAVELIFPKFANDQWITTIIEPVTTILISNENMLINKAASQLNQSIGLKASSSGPSTGNMGASGGRP